MGRGRVGEVVNNEPQRAQWSTEEGQAHRFNLAL